MTLSIQPLNLRCWSNYGCSHYCYVLPMKHLKSLNNLIKDLGEVTLTTWSSKSTGCLHNRWARYISIRTGIITWKWIFGQIASLNLIFDFVTPRLRETFPYWQVSYIWARWKDWHEQFCTKMHPNLCWKRSWHLDLWPDDPEIKKDLAWLVGHTYMFSLKSKCWSKLELSSENGFLDKS